MFEIKFEQLTQEEVKILHDSLLCQPMVHVEKLVNVIRTQVAEQTKSKE